LQSVTQTYRCDCFWTLNLDPRSRRARNVFISQQGLQREDRTHTLRSGMLDKVCSLVPGTTPLLDVSGIRQLIGTDIRKAQLPKC
jgi:hypothetical protein